MDAVARGLAAAAGKPTKKVGLVVFGQSNECGKAELNSTASFTGSISGTTLTVSAITLGGIYPAANGQAGSLIAGAGVTGSPTVVAQLSGTANGVGTYQITQSLTVASEAMTATAQDLLLFPQAFRSLRNPAINSYFKGIESLTQYTPDGRWYGLGAAWCKVYDDLYDAGYEPHIVNCAIGSLSFFNDAVSWPRPRNSGLNSQNFVRGRRAPIHASDMGTRGFFSVNNGFVFEATTASEYYVTIHNEGPPLVNSAGDTIPDRIDYIYSPTLAKKTTGGSIPDFTTGGAVVTASCSGTTLTVTAIASGALAVGQTVVGTSSTDFTAGTTIVAQLTGTAGSTGTYQLSNSKTVTSRTCTCLTVGGTITDGGVVWTNIGDVGTLGFANNTAFHINALGLGFDPYGVMRRAGRHIQELRAQGCGRVIVYLCQGQSDIGTSTANYQTALDYITAFFRGLGAEVCIGLTTYQRGAATTTGYDLLKQARINALADNASDSFVHAGADLYTSMGTADGPGNPLAFNTVTNDGVHTNAPTKIIEGGYHSAAILAALQARPSGY